jgi:hypothetical protein
MFPRPTAVPEVPPDASPVINRWCRTSRIITKSLFSGFEES